MKKHVKNYFDYFNLCEQDFVYCEYNWIINRVAMRAQDLHHIKYRSHGGSDEIENVMALSRDIHNMAHNEKLDRKHLQDIHQEFINNNPY